MEGAVGDSLGFVGRVARLVMLGHDPAKPRLGSNRQDPGKVLPVALWPAMAEARRQQPWKGCCSRSRGQGGGGIGFGLGLGLGRQAARPRLSHEEDVAERFQKKGPKEFLGTTDPLVAEGWIRSLETIFDYMGITDADRVKCATYMMKGDAALWWEGAIRGVHLPTLTWAEFRRIFYTKYFTEDVRSRMVREFMSLRQRDKSVVEYVSQFERGCHFVLLIADSAPEKLRQFIEGLRAEVKHDVRMMDVTTYEAAVSRALRSEEGRKEIQREQQGKRQFQPGYQRATSQPPAKKQYVGPSKGPNQQRPQGQQQQRGGAPKTGGVPICPQCQKPHTGKCLVGSNVCYLCKEPGHVSYNCPKRKNTTGRVFVIRIGIKPEVAEIGYDVTMSSGQVLSTTSICRGMEMDLQGRTIRADLVVLPLTGFDLILGMEWLSVNGAVIDFWQRTVAVKPEEGDQFVFYASSSSEISPMISYTRARKLLRRGCQGFLASLVTSAVPPTSFLAEIEVVRDFPNVFPDDVAGIPPAREVEFSIELMPDTMPISKAPFSPWEAPVLFVKKKNGT
ncbi:uncharacterized protein [Henckelia pumila]|uniref:uncharacterized protein n=1 Tax=Henckelia pumila TaxID=405737 RepID=UPI003C6EA3AC